MTLTDRDVSVLLLLRTYFFLRARQIASAVTPANADGSIVRGRLRAMEKAGLVRRCQKQIVHQLDPETAAPVWILTLRGSAELARARQDTALLFHCEPSFRDWSSLNHYTALSSLVMLVHRAIAAQARVRLSGLTFEHEVADPGAGEPHRRYKLYTLVSPEPRVACVPDAAFVLEVDGRRRAFLVEYETGSDSPARVAAKKHKGVALLHSTRTFLDLFPDVTDFRVLCFCPYASWRKTLIEQMRGKPGESLWLFMTTPEVTADTFLHGELVWKTDGEKPVPLVAPGRVSGTPLPPGGGGGGATGGVREAVDA